MTKTADISDDKMYFPGENVIFSLFLCTHKNSLCFSLTHIQHNHNQMKAFFLSYTLNKVNEPDTCTRNYIFLSNHSALYR